MRAELQYKRAAAKKQPVARRPFSFGEKFFAPKGLKRCYINRFFSFYFDRSRGTYEKNLAKISFASVTTFFVGKGYFLGKISFFSFYGRLFFKGWSIKFIKAMFSSKLFGDGFLRRLFYKRSGFSFVPFRFHNFFLSHSPFVVFSIFRQKLRRNRLKRVL